MDSLSLMIKPVSGACDMRCRYCFYSDEMRSREVALYPKMSLETLERLVRRAMQCAGNEVHFAFQGGEPTLAGADFFRALIKFQRMYNTKQLRVGNSIQTNGVNLTDELAELFAEEGFLVGLSLDGIEQTHDINRLDRSGNGTYSRVIAAADTLKRAGCEFNILCVVNKYVASRPKEVYNSLAPYGFIQFITCLDGLDGQRRDYSVSQDELFLFNKAVFDCYYDSFIKGRSVSVRIFDNYVRMLMGMPPEACSMTGRCSQYFLVEGDGSVYPCDFYALDEYRLGNINDTTFSRLEKSEISRRFIEESVPVPEKCRACEWYFLCRNGCRRERDGITGVNIWCGAQKEFFAYAYDRLRMMAQRLSEDR